MLKLPSLLLFTALFITISSQARELSHCAILNKLIAGEKFDEIIVVVHQIPALVDATISRFATSEYKDVPIVVLNYRERQRSGPKAIFHVINTELATRAVDLASDYGELSPLILVGDRIHVAGGNCGVCLSQTLEEISKAFLISSEKEMTIVLHYDLTYGAGVDGHNIEKFLQTTFNTNDSFQFQKSDKQLYERAFKAHPDRKMKIEFVSAY